MKLFPRDCTDLVLEVQGKILEKTGKHVEVMVYGDGAFKDPVGKIWELADPCVSVSHTEGLNGTPNEVKLKYLADNDFKDLKGEELTRAMKEKIEAKDGSLKGSMASQGTTPRRLTDLIGSLCDLTSGSGDKGTPIVFIQGYFDTFAGGFPPDLRRSFYAGSETGPWMYVSLAAAAMTMRRPRSVFPWSLDSRNFS